MDHKGPATLVDADNKKRFEQTKMPAPVIVDLGGVKKAQIKELALGEGKLTERVLGVLEELRHDGTVDASAQPVIVIVRQKAGRKKGLLGHLL